MDKEFSIATVERETGISRETLRIWEHRYGFPHPGRNATGKRVFVAQDIERLLLIKRLMNMGHRPGRVVPLPMQALLAMGGDAAMPEDREASRPDALWSAYQPLLRQARLDELRQTLEQALLRHGLSRFIREIIAPLTKAVGEAWLLGELPVHEEHAYTEVVMQLLRRTLDKLPSVGGEPRILLTTASGELHGLGLLMAECLFCLAGARCVSLGVNLPSAEIAAAAERHRARIVALSFSPAYPRRQIVPVLSGLREQLEDSVEIWIGGGTVRHLRLPPGVLRCARLDDLAEQVDHWRQRHAQHAAA